MNTDIARGLSEAEARLLLEQNGPNALPESRPDSVFTIFFRQFRSPLIYILFLAAGAVLLIGETADAAIIAAVLIFNAIVGAVQEGKAQNALLALKKFVETRATVLRDGREVVIPDRNVVTGDVIILQEGEKVPADAKVFLSNNLKLDESALTGESVPVGKMSETTGKDMVFRGTSVLAGSGRAMVKATGLDTSIGKIAKEVATIDTDTPLKKNIKYLSRAIIIIVVCLNAVLFLAGIFSGREAGEMFATLVSLSVSIVPEGLPIVMTLILAKGVWTMSKKNVLVRRLQAVEALGQAEIIAVDKTGTITRNELVVAQVFAKNKLFDTGDGLLASSHELVFVAENAALCALSKDPTELALLALAKKAGIETDVLQAEAPLVADFPFDYRLRLRGTLRKMGGKNVLIVTGAPENVLELCKVSDKEKIKLQNVFEQMSERGLRVVALCISRKPLQNASLREQKGLVFAGFLGMKDALRKEVPQSMKLAARAGVRVIMITGDHKITARAIAIEAGIYKDGDQIITGSELDAMDDNELQGKIRSVSVFARVSPEHKLRIIKAFRASKKIIAMTGDGVNDAPSLVSADLGVAMGKIGTEVAKEASDIILLDDNFGNIIHAMEEGRNIYKTIKKVVLYLFSTSFGEVLTISAAMFMGFPLPILPAQIIWLNFVTDGFLDVALAAEPKEKNLLSEKFKRPGKYLVDSLMVLRMFFMAVVMMAGVLFVFRMFGADLVKARTMALVTLAVFQWFNAWNCKSEGKSIFSSGALGNRFLIVATIIVAVLQVLAVYNPYLQKILQTTAIGFADWILCGVVALSIVAVEELRKRLFLQKREKND